MIALSGTEAESQAAQFTTIPYHGDMTSAGERREVS